METATQKVANAGIHGLESGADLVSAVSAAYTAMGTITGVVSSFWNWLQTPIAKSSSGDSGGQNLPWVQPCACGGWSGSSSGSGSSSSDGPSDIPDVPEVPWAA